MLQKIQKMFFVAALLISINSFAQNVQWKNVQEKEIVTNEKMQRNKLPKAFKLFKVDLPNLVENLSNAPEDTSGKDSEILIDFPDADGNIAVFKIFNSPMLEPELAKKFSGIKNFTGSNVKDPTNVVKICITPAFGMHVIGYDTKNTYQIDTYTTDFQNFIFYNLNDAENPDVNFECIVEEDDNENLLMNFTTSELNSESPFKQLRLAFASASEFSQLQINAAPNNIPKETLEQKKAIVLSALTIKVSQANSVLERDVNLRLVLINNNDDVIFIDSDFFKANDYDLGTANVHDKITQVIGTENFDLGHGIFRRNGGGSANVGSICVDWKKGRGRSGQNQGVVTEAFHSTFLHEIGHQLGSPHSHTGDNNNCNGIGGDAGVEPGSGSTVMSYSGSCGNIAIDNIRLNYFTIKSIRIIEWRINQRGCATVISNSNPKPVILSTSGSKTIPHSTPFILKTSATDDNNPNSLTYSWEQVDYGTVTQPPLSTSTIGPNFRWILPTTNTFRSFPSEETVLAGTTNPDGVISSTWERLPSVARVMHFWPTVRDNNIQGGGQTANAEIEITFANVGPFVITYPDNIITTNEPMWTYGSDKNITWNVAGTDANGINTSHVNILLSTDGGQTYTMLEASVPNTGSKTITICNSIPASNECRIKIEAVDNIFYTVSKSFQIGGEPVKPIFTGLLPQDITISCDNIPEMETLTAADVCGDIQIISSENKIDGDCLNTYQLIRIWTATDAYGNFSTHTQTINVKDTTAPTFVETLPENITVSCENIPVMEVLTAIDICGTAQVITSESRIDGTCSNNYQLIRIWTATDACGNFVEHTQTINVEDTTVPVFVEALPENITVSCENIPVMEVLTATDICGTAQVISSEIRIDGTCSNTYQLLRTWTATDACGNFVEHTQTINVEDTTAPVFVETLPENITVSCENIPVMEVLTATDICGTAQVISSEIRIDGTCSNTYQLLRTWTATDACGNFVEHTQTINVEDTTAPVFVETLPENITVSCENIPEIQVLTATDICGTVQVISSEIRIDGTCSNTYQLLRTWTATDACGNFVEHTQTINVEDTTAPVFVETLPENITVSCENIPEIQVLTAIDNCGNTPINVVFTTFMEEQDCLTGYEITRTWTATDLCGNQVSHSQIITVEGSTASNNDFEFENFKMYPNPTSDIVAISFRSITGKEISIEIFDIRGRFLKQHNFDNSGAVNLVIDFSSYSSGTYLVQIKDGNHKIIKKIVKE